MTLGVGQLESYNVAKNFFKDKFFWIAAIIGVVLMLLTFHFNINPVEGSVFHHRRAISNVTGLLCIIYLGYIKA